MVIKIRDTKTRQAIPVPTGSHSMGRDESNEIHVSDSSVSRRHAIITNSDEGLFIEDLGSSNGTAVRGEFITNKTPLKMGDMFFLGNISFKVEPEVTGELVKPKLSKEALEKNRPSSKEISKVYTDAQSIDDSIPKVKSPANLENLETGVLKPVQVQAKTALTSGATLKLPSQKALEEKSLKRVSQPKVVPSISLPTVEEMNEEIFSQSPAVPGQPLPPSETDQNLSASNWKIICVVFFIVGIVVGFFLHHFSTIFP